MPDKPTPPLIDKLEKVIDIVTKVHETQQAQAAQLATNEATIQKVARQVDDNVKELKGVLKTNANLNEQQHKGIKDKLEITNERVEIFKDAAKLRTKGVWVFLVVILSTIGTLWAYNMSTNELAHNNTAILAAVQAELNVSTKLDTLISHIDTRLPHARNENLPGN